MSQLTGGYRNLSSRQGWTDLGLEGVDTITAEMQESVKDGIVAFLDDKFAVTIDGQAVEGEIDRVNFLERTLRSSVVVDGRDIDLLPATVGVIYVFPTKGLPQLVEMEWDLFSERMPLVPASTVDQAGPLPTFLEEGFSTLKWENFLKNPELPTLTEIPDGCAFNPRCSLCETIHCAHHFWRMILPGNGGHVFYGGTGLLGSNSITW